MGTISRTVRPTLTRRDGSFTGRQGASLLRRGARRLADLLILWQKRLRDREALRQMTPAQLMDIGLGREDALREAEKPFWRR